MGVPAHLTGQALQLYLLREISFDMGLNAVESLFLLRPTWLNLGRRNSQSEVAEIGLSLLEKNPLSLRVPLFHKIAEKSRERLHSSLVHIGLLTGHANFRTSRWNGQRQSVPHGSPRKGHARRAERDRALSEPIFLTRNFVLHLVIAGEDKLKNVLSVDMSGEGSLFVHHRLIENYAGEPLEGPNAAKILAHNDNCFSKIRRETSKGNPVTRAKGSDYVPRQKKKTPTRGA